MPRKRRIDFGDPSPPPEAVKIRKIGPTTDFFCLPDELLAEIFRFLGLTPFGVDFACTCSYVYGIMNSPGVWNNIQPLVSIVQREQGRQVISWNLASCKCCSMLCDATEGFSFKAVHRPSGKGLVLKRTKLDSTEEGVPYYMIRGLCLQQLMKHPNILASDFSVAGEEEILSVSSSFDTHLAAILVENNTRPDPVALDLETIRSYSYQLLQALYFLHSHGYMHRNIKSKHIAVCDRGATVKLMNLGLGRVLELPSRLYTTEINSLWTRSPEVLFRSGYSFPADVWALGVVFGEMALGKPPFWGICELDHLYQIFSRLGYPEVGTYPSYAGHKIVKEREFTHLFPAWPSRTVAQAFPEIGGLSEVFADLLDHMFKYEPSDRFTAYEALQHPFFDPIRGCSISRMPVGSGEIDALVEAVWRDIQQEVAADGPTAGVRPVSLVCGAEEGTGWTDMDPTEDSTYTILTVCGALDSVSLERSRHRGFSRASMMRDGVRHRLHMLMNVSCKKEQLPSPHPQVYSAHEHISPPHRYTLMDWVTELVNHLNLSDRVLITTAALVDDWISRNPGQRLTQLQLVGVTALYTASKLHDVLFIAVDDASRTTDGTFSKEQILELEQEMLNAWQFRVWFPTVYDFAMLFGLLYDPEQSVPNLQHLIAFVAEQTMFNPECFIGHCPTSLGLGVMLHSLAVLHLPPPSLSTVMDWLAPSREQLQHCSCGASWRRWTPEEGDGGSPIDPNLGECPSRDSGDSGLASDGSVLYIARADSPVKELRLSSSSGTSELWRICRQWVDGLEAARREAATTSSSLSGVSETLFAAVRPAADVEDAVEAAMEEKLSRVLQDVKNAHRVPNFRSSARFSTEERLAVSTLPPPAERVQWPVREIPDLHPSPETVEVTVRTRKFPIEHFSASKVGVRELREIWRKKRNCLAVVDSMGWNLVHWAAARGNCDVLQYLWTVLPRLFCAKDKENRTPLQVAQEHGKTAAAEFLTAVGLQ